jgi:MIP family channel proteins
VIKRYGAEVVGTFSIVLAPVAWAAGGAEGGLLAAALVSGLIVLAMVYALGPISAAHFNPAVTLGFAVAGRFPWRFVPAYWGCQILGAILAASLVWLLFGRGGWGAHIPVSPELAGRNFGMEAMLGFLLMFVVVAVATDRRVSGAVPALAIGLTIVMGVLVGGPVTGGSMNPARSLGPALFAGGEALTHLWVYIAGPTVGAVIGARAFELLRIEKAAAIGAPNEILEALIEIDD